MPLWWHHQSSWRPYDFIIFNDEHYMEWRPCMTFCWHCHIIWSKYRSHFYLILFCSIVNKQINDKERVAAALENPSLLKLVNECIKDSDRWWGLKVGEDIVARVSWGVPGPKNSRREHDWPFLKTFPGMRRNLFPSVGTNPILSRVMCPTVVLSIAIFIGFI